MNQPIAWAFEETEYGDKTYEKGWKRRVSLEKPFNSTSVRNVVPLYSTGAEEAIRALNEIHAILDREIEGATETLAMNLTPEARQSACGWLSAAKGIQIAVTKVWPKKCDEGRVEPS